MTYQSLAESAFDEFFKHRPSAFLTMFEVSSPNVAIRFLSRVSSQKLLSRDSSIVLESAHIMPTITFINEKKSVEVPVGSNLRREAIRAGIQLYPVPHNYVNCLGLGVCTSCRVLIKKGLENISHQSLYEKFTMTALNPLTFFARIGNETTLRLACQMQVNGDVEVQTQPPLNWHGENFWS